MWGGDIGAEATGATGAKTAAGKTVSNFSQALRCMGELVLAYGKQGIGVTSAGITDVVIVIRTGYEDAYRQAVSKYVERTTFLAQKEPRG